MRVVERLVSDEPVDLGGFETGIVEARFHAFQME